MLFIETFAYEIIVILIYVINFLVILNLIFREKRSIEATFAWIIILSAVPALGFIMYLIFGRGVSKDNMFRVKEKEDKIIKNNILDTQFRLKYHSNLNASVAKHRDMIYALANSNSAHFTNNNDVSIYPKSIDFFDTLLEDLRQAKHYINIQFYIFKDDKIGSEIINILLQKAHDGVEVRLLYDAVGSRLISDKTILQLRSSGVKVGAFFPSFLKIVNFNLNYRNHRKIVVIDGKIGFVGGNNVGDEYLGRNPKFGGWRDTHIKLMGDSVKDLNLRFILDWRYTTREDLDLDKYFKYDSSVNKDYTYVSSDNVGIQIVSSGPDAGELEEIKYGYIKMIQKAKDYVYIQTPYLILDQTLLETLKIACLSGVDVRIMIPSKPDHPFVYWASYSYAGELLKYGAKIYTYDKNSFLHAKTVVMDDSICSIGTANMDIRSFALNFEVNAFMYSSNIAKQQKKIFEDDITKCKNITLDDYNDRTRIIRFKESISRLLSPLL